MTIIFTLIDKTVGLRVSADEEIVGLDIKEHGLSSSYADFMPSTNPLTIGNVVSDVSAPTPANAIITNSSEKPKKMTKISIIINQDKLDILKAALDNMGITGITVTQVLGCGMQKGHIEYYRGVEYDTHLLPKIKVDIIVCAIPVDTVISTVKKLLKTGRIGDGKIFVYDVENVIKIRTGEEGYDALQDNA